MSLATLALAAALTVGLAGAQTAAPTIVGQTDAPTIYGQTEVPTVPGGTAAPTVLGQTPAPTVGGSTGAPTVDGSTGAPTILEVETPEPTSDEGGVGAGKGGEFLGLGKDQWAYAGPLLAVLVLFGVPAAYYLHKRVVSGKSAEAGEYDDATPHGYGTLEGDATAKQAGGGDDVYDAAIADLEAPHSPLVGGSPRSGSGGSGKIALGDVITDTEIAITSK